MQDRCARRRDLQRHGNRAGSQADYDSSAGAYTIANVLSFTITPGSTDFVVGDQFTFATTRDPCRKIKALLGGCG